MKTIVSYGGNITEIKPIRKNETPAKAYKVKNPTIDRAKKILALLASH